MPKKFRYDVVHRWEGNPLITLEDIPFPCNTVFNAACAKYQGGYILLLRVEDLTGRSVFALARSDDGYHFTLDDGEQLKIYYGASDTCICLGTANINELMQFCTIGEH